MSRLTPALLVFLVAHLVLIGASMGLAALR
jgi:hypothetical protein